MDQVMLEVDLHLVNNIRVIYYVVSNSVEKRVLMNKINGILTKKVYTNSAVAKTIIIVYLLKKFYIQR